MGLGFLSMLALVVLTLFGTRGQATESGSEESEGKTSAVVEQTAVGPGRHHQERHGRSNPALAYVNLLLILFLVIAVLTTVISQYYAILGFIQSLPNNSDFASSRGQDSTDEATHGDHGPWEQGKALSVYLTCAWGFALAAGVIAGKVWPVPNWRID